MAPTQQKQSLSPASENRDLTVQDLHTYMIDQQKQIDLLTTALERVTQVLTPVLQSFDDPSMSGRRRMVDPAHRPLKDLEALLKVLTQDVPEDERLTDPRKR